eukprot:1182448-Prorocentrum_minimum.AAC.2
MRWLHKVLTVDSAVPVVSSPTHLAAVRDRHVRHLKCTPSYSCHPRPEAARAWVAGGVASLRVLARAEQARVLHLAIPRAHLQVGR